MSCLLVPFFPKENKITAAQARAIQRKGYRLSQDVSSLFRQSLEHLILSVLEFFSAKALLDRGLVKATPEAEKIIAESVAHNRGIIAITGHFGNFELLAAYFAHRGIPTTVVGRSANIGFIGKLIDKFRKLNGYETIWRGAQSAPMQFRRALKKGQILGILIDQDFATDQTFSPFFGIDAAHPSSVLEMTRVFKPCVRFPFITRQKDGSHKIDVYTLEEGEELLSKYCETLENVICQNPQQWLWWHRRWRRRPGEKKIRNTAEYLQWLESC